MPGITYDDAVVIIDEYQLLDVFELELVLTRLGKGSKMILCGDPRQTRDQRQTCCNSKALKELINDKVVGHIKLKGNHRNPALEKILTYFREGE
jgi:phosphate starvation-inducible PhoH-like protein